jgi:hypothetical protein
MDYGLRCLAVSVRPRYTMANVGFAMTAMTQGAAGALCFYFIFEVTEKRRDVLEALPNDEEVAEADAIMMP